MSTAVDPERKNAGRPGETGAAGVSEAKARFLRAAADCSPLNYVRAHPLGSLGSAFALGAGLGLLHTSAGARALLPLVVQATDLAVSLGLLPGMRGKGGQG